MGNSNTKAIYDTSDNSDEDYTDVNLDEFANFPNATDNDTAADAAVGQRVSLPTAQDCLTVEKLKEIENELDPQEVISLLYLLIEDQDQIECHLQYMIVLMQGGNPGYLSEWANSKKNDTWQNKLVEAMCIIKNFRILKSLGYEKFDVINQFLPNSLSTLYISKLRKVLYLICDNLDCAKTIEFLQHMRQNFKQRGDQFVEYGVNYLEVHLLKWESIRRLNLKEIKSILKLMGRENLCDNLESILPEVPPELYMRDISVLPDTKKPSTSRSSVSIDDRDDNLNWHDNQRSPKRTRKPSSVTSVDNQKLTPLFDNDVKMSLPAWQEMDLKDIVENHLGESNFLHFQHELTPNSSPIKTNIKKNNFTLPRNLEDCYSIDPNNPGTVLIINQENFYTEFKSEYKHLLPKGNLKLEIRRGTERDKIELTRIFKGFRFTVNVKNDLSHLDMLEVIKQTCSKISNESSLFVCILSHGDAGVVYGSNSCAVKVNDIKKIISGTNTANLEGKPKVLILQSCQGQLCQKFGTPSDNEQAPLTTDGPTISYRDILTFWATIPGYAAIRNKKEGSWFIQSLCQAMVKYHETHHFADICTKANGTVQKQTWEREGEEGQNAMTSLLEHTMGKSFYLPPLNLDY